MQKIQQNYYTPNINLSNVEIKNNKINKEENAIKMVNAYGGNEEVLQIKKGKEQSQINTQSIKKPENIVVDTINENEEKKLNEKEKENEIKKNNSLNKIPVVKNEENSEEEDEDDASLFWVFL